MRTYAAPLGRLMLSLIFLVSGVGKIAAWTATAAYMANKGMPAVPFFLGCAVFAEIGGGLAVLTGFAGRLGAFGLFLYLVPTTVIFHNFWALAGPERTMQGIQFLKNVAIMGGLLVLVAQGPGRWSVGRRRYR